jgi:3-isopropylmalate dehydrogenase
MLLRHSLGLEDEARCIERAVLAAVAAGDVTADVNPLAPKSTVAVGSSIIQQIAATPRDAMAAVR